MMHEDYRIALYYCYVSIPDVSRHISFHSELAESLGLGGRVRVSKEGINGVVSGTRRNLLQYEALLSEELSQARMQEDSYGSSEQQQSLQDSALVVNLDMKYCALRRDLSVEDQLFESLSVKATPEVISLFSNPHEFLESTSCNNGQSKKRSRRPKHPPVRSNEEECARLPDALIIDTIDSATTTIMLDSLPTAPHLTPREWHERLTDTSILSNNNARSDVVLLDARNVYESNVGRFQVPGIPTLLTNTRKYASLPQVLRAYKSHLSNKHVLIYCTGGVRCERASAYLQHVVQEEWDSDVLGEPPRGIYQLQGGIQRYLEEYGRTSETNSAYSDEGHYNGDCLYRGKNFVFDPRRTDPLHGRDMAGRCLLCNAAHDDYDNGHAPSERKEARCCRCRVLVLVCNDCRSQVKAWGEHDEDNKDEEFPFLYCGGSECVDSGNSSEQAVLLESRLAQGEMFESRASITNLSL